MKRTKRKITALEITLFIILLCYVLLLILIFAWSLNTSLKTDSNFKEDSIGLTKSFHFANFINAFTESVQQVETSRGKTPIYLEGMLLNSVIYAGGSALVQVLCTATMAYCTARYKNIVSKIIHNVVIVTLVLPVVGTLPSLLVMLQQLHLYNSLIGVYIMKFGFNNIYYLIFYAAFSAVSWEYAESAFLDGASHFTVYLKIMMPLVATLLGTIFLMFFIQNWNDYQVPMLVIDDFPTAAVGIFHLSGSSTATKQEKLAGGIVLFIPLFIVFILLRNKIMGNLTEGGIKG